MEAGAGRVVKTGGPFVAVTFEGSAGGERGGVIMFEKSMLEKSMLEKSMGEKSRVGSKLVVKSKLEARDGSKFMDGSSPRYGPLGMGLPAWSNSVKLVEASGWTSDCAPGREWDAWSNPMEGSGPIGGVEFDGWSTSMKASYREDCPMGPELDAPEFFILSPISEL